MLKKHGAKDSNDEFTTSSGKQIIPKDLTNHYDSSLNKKAPTKNHKMSPSSKRLIYLDTSMPVAIGSNVSLPIVTSSSNISQHTSTVTVVTSIKNFTMIT
eukprot:7989112-Ditylum_brightwellii.AAC.1